MLLQVGFLISFLLQLLRCTKVENHAGGPEHGTSKHEGPGNRHGQVGDCEVGEECPSNGKLTTSVAHYARNLGCSPNRMPEALGEGCEGTDSVKKQSIVVKERHAFEEAKRALERDFADESSHEEEKGNDGVWDGKGEYDNGKVGDIEEGSDENLEVEEPFVPAHCKSRPKTSKMERPPRGHRESKAPLNIPSRVGILRHFPDKHHRELLDGLGLPLIRSMIWRPRSWPLLRKWAEEQDIPWEGFANALQETQKDSMGIRGDLRRRINKESNGKIHLSAYDNVQTVLALPQFIKLVNVDSRSRLYPIISMKKAFSEKSMEMISKMTLTAIHSQISQGRKYNENCEKLGITQEQYEKFIRLDATRARKAREAQVYSSKQRRRAEKQRNQFSSKGEQKGNAKKGLSSRKRAPSDLLDPRFLVVKELVGKWDQIDFRLKDWKMKKFYRIYQDFANGGAKMESLFIGVLGGLMPHTAVEYFCPYKLKSLRSRFIKMKEAESWPIMEEYLRGKDKATDAALDELSRSLSP